MQTVFVDLLMDTGELTRIECPAEHEDALLDSLDNAMKRGAWWAPGQFDGCCATYLGTLLTRVSMRRVVGVL